MDEQRNNIRVLFTSKADSALDDLMKNFNLQETPQESVKRNREKKLSKIVVIDHLIKDLATGIITEKDLIDSLQKDFEVSQQTAEQISKEAIAKIIPFLEKVPEEKFKDPIFVEELTKKVFGETSEAKKEIIGEKEFDLFPKIELPINVAEQKEENVMPPAEEPKGKATLPSKKQERVKKPIAPEQIKGSASQTRQSKGSDTYREPIE